MKIYPSVLFLTFAGFLPNDCDAMVPNFEITGEIQVHTEHHTFGGLFLAARMVPLWLEKIDSTAPNFDEYQAFVRLADSSIHSCGVLNQKTPVGNPDRDHVPRSFEAEIHNVKYECKDDCHWQTYVPASPPSQMVSHLLITIPYSKRVLYTAIRSENVAREAQKIEEILKNYDASGASSSSLRDHVLRMLHSQR